MTKQHFITAAKIVNNIRLGFWTDDAPSWADKSRYGDRLPDTYTRAVQTAEAYIHLFRQYDPRFDSKRFLIACGLQEKPQ